MDRWTSTGGKSQRTKEKKRDDQRRERVRRKKIQVHEKVGKSRFTVFFQWFVAPEGRKVGSLQRRAQRHLVRWEMNNCTPLWREAHFEVKMYKKPGSEHFWKLRCRKSAHRCGAKHISKSKVLKTDGLGALLEVEMLKKCTRFSREAHFQVKMLKAPHARTTFEGSDVILRGRCKGFCTLPKVSKTWGFCRSSKNDGRRGAFAEDLQRCLSRGRRSATDMFMRDVKRSGRWFPERGCILEHQICRFAAMDDFAWQVQHFVWPGITLSGQAQHFRQMEWKNRKTHWYEAVSSALNFPFLKEVSQNCFVFDVVKFKN